MAERRLFILGAGASYAAGLPLGDELPLRLWAFLGNSFTPHVNNLPRPQYFAPLSSWVFEALWENKASQQPQSLWPIDRVFSKFYQELALDASKVPLVNLLLEAMAMFFYSSSCRADLSIHRDFVDRLSPNDIVFTFNWDACLELAALEAGVSFHRGLIGDADTDGPRLLKAHGSVDYALVPSETRSFGEQPYSAAPQEAHDTVVPPFLEALGAQAPSQIWKRRLYEYRLYRLKTYDVGQVMAVEPNDAVAESIPGYPDVGAYSLLHSLPEYPTLFMLSPGSPQALYDWYYRTILECISETEIKRIYVIGYSFPHYDTRALKLIGTIARKTGFPTADVVNPAAATLPHDVLRSTLREYRLHAKGFREALDDIDDSA